MKKVAANNQNKTLWRDDNGPQISYSPKLYKGKINKIRMAVTIAITPPSLSGKALKIA
jgi:hypothetical protein